MASGFDRRWFLRGFMGAAIGLPLLDIMQGRAHAQSAPPPRRFVVFFEHGGTLSNVSKTGVRYDGTGAEGNFDGWAPPGSGETLTALGEVQAPLAGHLEALLVLRGIDNRAARLITPQDSDHGWANATALTAGDAQVKGGGFEGDKEALAPSIESVLAQRLAQRHPVPFEAVHLLIDGYNYGTPFYRASQQPILGQKNPVAAFDTLFSGVSESDGGADPVTARARALEKSILDGTGEMTRRLKRRLGARDQQTLEAHLEHLRTLEQRIEKMAPTMEPGCHKPEIAASFATPDEVGKAHVDLLAAALRCGLTNVGALEIGDIETLWLSPPYTSPIGNGHDMHHLSASTGQQGVHYAVRADWKATMVQNRRWRMSLLARLLDHLAALPEGPGTMRDHTLILWTSEFSNGGVHSSADLPILLAGGASGRLRMGRQVNYNLKANDPTGYDTKASTHNLFTSILNAFDYPDTHFGNQSAYVQGPLWGLT